MIAHRKALTRLLGTCAPRMAMRLAFGHGAAAAAPSPFPRPLLVRSSRSYSSAPPSEPAVRDAVPDPAPGTAAATPSTPAASAAPAAAASRDRSPAPIYGAFRLGSGGAAGAGEVHENIYTIPNAMSLARLVSTPFVGYFIVTEQFTPALALFAVSAVTDALDGYIARNFNMRSVLGTILDPMADKALMTTLTVSLGYVGLIPLPLAVLIIGRDAGLVISSFVVRYKSLPPPKTFARFWDFSLPSAEVRPTLISKANTVLQLGLVGGALAAPVAAGTALATMWATWAPALHWTVAATTLWSGLSYVFSRDAVRYLHPPPKDAEPGAAANAKAEKSE
ncbi:hypothetical protein AMAG_10310 [Allomyces macrogynus ATCC 38327]|uniref:CDP-diacylglycerol-glycerol-3-phosphate 3-phosphatidyltransferase n=1 Tax=Allomyces macrogynus (strain ATCC 38327) TaxID=578462 RepID=A0A0L0SU30_ALLM3|nr:hypothetical protein AMAG_10310 [Allomyces macrogynus ATCC 38327]|eukprot:KNE66042.1 hypothetical protein AMAG_10310 [Allomyces macrogynus ATCC 38327]